MSTILAQKLVLAVEGMPAFPESVRKILVLTQDINCTPKDLVQVIGKDPVVTVRILRVVNSSYYSLPKKISSLDHAVVYLGFNTIKNLAVAIAAIGALPQKNPAGFEVQPYLQHCLSTAAIAKYLASRVPDADPVDCFIAGLLHDFGKIVLAQFKPVEFRLALRNSQEEGESLHLTLRKIIGVDHATVGAMLVEKWQFPSQLIEAIRYQYGPELPDTSLSACVFAANQISKKLELGFAGNTHVEEFPVFVRQRLGGTLEDLLLTLGDMKSMFEDVHIASLL
ncbi:HDOD domain-containing protein [Rhodoferax saidenbachensis]|uniref:Nucleotidyltransferase with HDIG domain n=1 Tax=Rhodoferax saidenbachensis TaxID=1484693 RepID=A0ABU1ZHP2_9BURK|nr:HDOD domain-containing protein [Rhodoferax saidenbachensis]MDR7305061.1 putative nucleotidyltransferase with HDIG domain [Rhodoferax saidenbachensis]